MTQSEQPRKDQSAERPVQQETGTGQSAEEWGQRQATAEQIASGGKQREQATPPERRSGA